MDIIVLGETGQVGQSLKELDFAPHSVKFLSRNDVSFEDPQTLSDRLSIEKPHVVINAAAYTSVDKAEDEQALTTTVNAEAVAAMARYCADNNAKLIHYSTDYVFDGSGTTPRDESATTAPVNHYGFSKLLGEKEIIESGAHHMILRTSWVFSPFGHNFVKSMLRLGSEKEELRIVDDQIGSPTSALDIARATKTAMEYLIRDPNTHSGLYHLTGKGYVSWCGFAKEIFKQWQALGHRLSVKSVNGISTQEYPTPAKRPLNSRLDCSKFESKFNYVLPPWQNGLKEVLERLS